MKLYLLVKAVATGREVAVLLSLNFERNVVSNEIIVIQLAESE